ncbi:putative alkaline shock family protein YloU [Rhodococcus sp. AG1013]|uniref:DUF6286 domain-containing Asp23/Gls24 family envelope stress response protein n=1 Tax=Rhodococcus sp. AG1013 TaxID=2183996 RepID=UPI000E0B3318|nr:DUF6286 domain-containing Asp23/Gls24 family envelope stress response protein [Rhodococcus sp. AG1013]RDI33903.1 putative alkaline shock family protein YloU [Rhodococcus sp. AG1013]
MAEPDTEPSDAPPAQTAIDEPGSRGSLVIKDRAIAKIATTAALQVPGVVSQGGGLTRFTGRELPRADVSTGTRSVAVNLYLGVHWPCDVAELTRRVHHEVGEQVENLTGMPLHQLGVLVAGTGPDTPGDSDIACPTPSPADTVTAPRPPAAAPAAVPAAILIALGLLGLAAVAARELLISRGTISGAPWLRNTFEWLGRLHWEQWLVPVALAGLVVGILFVLLALAPRTRTHVPLRADDGVATVWMRPVDVARMCSARAGTVPGVVSAHTTVDRRRATVHAITDAAVTGPDADNLREAVVGAVGDGLSLLGRPLKLRVRTRTDRKQARS